MYAIAHEYAYQASKNFPAGVWPAVIGVAIVALLIAAVAFGIRRRAREPAPPEELQFRAGAWQTREELDNPKPGDHGPGHQREGPYIGHLSERRAPDEVPHDGRRRFPYEIKDFGTRAADDDELQPGPQAPPPANGPSPGGRPVA